MDKRLFKVIASELIEVIGHATFNTPRGDAKATHGDILYIVEEIAEKIINDKLETKQETIATHRFVVPAPLAIALNLPFPTSETVVEEPPAAQTSPSPKTNSSSENSGSSSPSPGGEGTDPFAGLGLQ